MRRTTRKLNNKTAQGLGPDEEGMDSRSVPLICEISGLDGTQSTSYTESDYLTSLMAQSEERMQSEVVIKKIEAYIQTLLSSN